MFVSSGRFSGHILAAACRRTLPDTPQLAAGEFSFVRLAFQIDSRTKIAAPMKIRPSKSSLEKSKLKWNEKLTLTPSL